MTDAPFAYTGLTACTLAPDANSSYLANMTYKATPVPLSSPTMGLMMLLSTLQYQSPYMNPTYSNAASQAGKAAFMVSGGQGIQDNGLKMATKNGMDFAHSIGLTDTEMGIAGIGYKTYRTRQIDVNGPNIYILKSHLTINTDGGSIGLGWKF
jgi:hypothetical protein